ncbi:MAG: PQQ-dependent sugar dehydrogenase [Trueperaceae bacterium]|nr:PQQ-dependent sugar dehydrogenase [Trueperaceae bacterium]
MKQILLLLLLLTLLSACASKSSFAISLSKEAIELDQGPGEGKTNIATLTVTVSRSGSNSSSVNLEASNLPNGVTVNPVVISAGKTNGTLTFVASQTAAEGDYEVTVKGTSDNTSAERTVRVKIFANSDFILIPSLSSLTLEQGSVSSLEVQVSRDVSFRGDITVDLETNPFVEANSVTLADSQTVAKLELTPLQISSGVKTINILAQSENSRYTYPIEFTVMPPAADPDFDFSLSPTELELPWNLERDLKVSVLRNSRFTGTIEISPVNVPDGITVSSLTLDAAQQTGIIKLEAGPDTGTSTAKIVFEALGTGDFANVRNTATLTVTTLEKPTIKTEVLATGLTIPWDIEFAPDGSLYITERGGKTKLYKDGAVTELSNSLAVYAPGGEPGLMGMTLDPDFASNNHMYVCYTYEVNKVHENRISRVTVSGSSLIDEKILVDEIPGGSIHDGCRLKFGPDGNLYASTGDAGYPNFSQDTKNLAGKILRIKPDGSIPSDNPFGTAVWTYGLRNTQGLVFHPNGNLYGTEHGDADNDEINSLKINKNYGWPNVNGTQKVDGYEPALRAYTPTIAPAGIIVYEGDLFPEFQGDLLFVTLKTGGLHHLELNEDGSIKADNLIFDNDFGRLRDIEVAPDGRIFIVTSNQDGRARGDLGFPLEEDDRLIALSR